jgi:hypothetical protein
LKQNFITQASWPFNKYIYRFDTCVHTLLTAPAPQAHHAPTGKFYLLDALKPEELLHVTKKMHQGCTLALGITA